MASEIERLEKNIAALLAAVPYLTAANGGTILGAGDVKSLLDLTTQMPPAAIIVFNGEIATKNETIGATLQASTMEWSIFVVAESYAVAGEGRLGTVGAYQMIDDVLATLEGKLISLVEVARLFYVRSRRYNVTTNAVIYEMVFRNAYLRTG
jgi:hypothetical protein